MNDELKTQVRERLEILFVASNIIQMEEKYEKDVQNLEQMKLDFCEIYKKYINLCEFEIEEPIPTHSSVNNKIFNHLDFKLINNTIESVNENTSPRKNGKDRSRTPVTIKMISTKSNGGEECSKTPIKLEKRNGGNEKKDEKKENFKDRSRTPMAMKKITFLKSVRENKNEEKSFNKKDEKKEEKLNKTMRNETKEKPNKDEPKTEEKKDRVKREELKSEMKEKCKKEEIKVEEKKEKNQKEELKKEKPKEKVKKEEVLKEKPREKTRNDRNKKKLEDSSRLNDTFDYKTEEIKREFKLDDIKEDSKKLSSKDNNIKVEKSVKKKEEKKEDKKEEKKKEDKPKKDDKKAVVSAQKIHTFKETKYKDLKENKNKLNLSAIKENGKKTEEMEKNVEEKEKKGENEEKSVQSENSVQNKEIDPKLNEVDKTNGKNEKNLLTIDKSDINEKVEEIEDKHDIQEKYLETEKGDSEEHQTEKEVKVDDREGKEVEEIVEKGKMDPENDEKRESMINETEENICNNNHQEIEKEHEIIIEKNDLVINKDNSDHNVPHIINNTETIKVYNSGSIKLKLNPLAEKNLGTNVNKAFLLMLLKNYIPSEKIRVRLFTSNKFFPLLKEPFLRNILEINESSLKSYSEITQKYAEVNKRVKKDLTVEVQVSKPFTPSKTAQNGLNFITRDEESNLSKKEQPNEIINIFRLIYMIVDEEYEYLPQNQIISNFIQVLLPKLKGENLKQFFLNYIGRVIVISPSQHNKITKFLAENPKILNSSELLKINRSISYMTFMVKEILDYTSLKTNEGDLVMSIRYAKEMISEVTTKVSKLKGFIN